jgi:hypothetical protein
MNRLIVTVTMTGTFFLAVPRTALSLSGTKTQPARSARTAGATSVSMQRAFRFRRRETRSPSQPVRPSFSISAARVRTR